MASPAAKRLKQAAEGAGAVVPRSPAPRAASALAADRRLRLMSWNLNGYKSTLEKHKKDFIQVIREESPDLVFVSETKLQEQNAGAFATAVDGFKAHFTCSTAKKGYAGCALLVRNEIADKIRKISFGLGGAPVVGQDEGRSITVELDGMFLVLLYVVNSGQKLERLSPRVEEWDLVVRNYCRTLAKTKPVLVGGDLNVAHNDIDVYNPTAKHLVKQAGTTPQERASFSKWLDEDGMVDTFRALHPEASGWYTYWSVRAGNREPNKGLRLDYFLASKALMSESHRPRIHDSWIVPDAPAGVSDHGPILVDLEV